MLTHCDDLAQSLGLYQRAARFHVISAQAALAANRWLIEDSFAEAQFAPEDRALLEPLIARFMEHVLILPAASTHHHRGAGGLFYHSLEVATLAASAQRKAAVGPMVLAAYVAGLLHDLGKIVTLFEVSAYDPAKALGWRPTPPALIWDSATESLGSWCARHQVKALGLRYRAKPIVGHVTETARLWRGLVGEALMARLEESEAGAAVVSYLDDVPKRGPLRETIMSADCVSMMRDIAPEVRFAPKRSDLFLVRRFIEFAMLSPWNADASPFLSADVLIGGEPTGFTLPFFEVSPASIDQFRAYLMSEDRWGHVWADQFAAQTVAQLEHFGILRRNLPSGLNCPLHTPTWNETDFGVGRYRRANLIYLNGERDQFLPLAYCPLTQTELRAGLPEAVVNLPGRRGEVVWS